MSLKDIRAEAAPELDEYPLRYRVALTADDGKHELYMELSFFNNNKFSKLQRNNLSAFEVSPNMCF